MEYSLPTWYYVLILVMSAISLAAEWKVLEKAGEPGWKILIPFYNTYTLFKIVYGNGWRFLLLLIPFANIVFAIMFLFDLAKAYGQSKAFGFGLLLLDTIFILIMAVDERIQYVGSKNQRKSAEN